MDSQGGGLHVLPCRVEGHAYMHLGNGRISCLNLDTGEESWRSTESFGKYWSMVYRDDKILALDETGELILFNANPEAFQVLSRKEVTKSSAWGYLAVVGDELFVRELEGITAFKWLAGSAKKTGP